MCSLMRVLFGFLLVSSVLQICLAVIGDNCVHDRCVGNEVNAFCLKHKCVCREDQAISDNRLKCLEVASNVGESCEEDVQCTIKLTEWASCNKSKQCACSEGANFTNGQCEKIKILGDSCESSRECLHIPNANCSSTPDTGTPVCACTTHHVPSTNSLACLSSAATNLAPCELDLQCQSLGDNTTCLNKQCQCKEANHFNIDGTLKNMCVYNRGIDDSCKTGDCHLPRDTYQNIECRAGTCVCKNGTIHIIGENSCRAIPVPSNGDDSGNNSWVWFLVAAVCAGIAGVSAYFGVKKFRKAT